MIKNITYEDKIAIQNDESVDRKNKVTDADMNEIKEVVNANADEQTTQNTDISNIKKEQETQNTNIEENNSKIVELQTEKAKLETELKEIQEDFYQNSIRGQASGEYIHVEDSSNCRAKIGIGGNSEQETREGYNLLPPSKQYTYTSGNVKLASDGAGKYTMNGDGTAQTETIKYTFELEKEYTIKNNDYLHIMNNGTVTSNAIIILLDSNKSGVVSYDFTTNNKIENLSNYAGKTIKYIQLYVNPIKVDITLTPMIINNVSTAKNFEQYGAMPSPDYPSEIKTVGDNLNLLDIDKTTYDLTINLQKEGEYLKGNNVNIIRIGTFNDSRPQIEEKFKNGNYTISYEVEANSNVTILNLFLCVIYEDDTQENVGSGKSYSLEEGTKQKVFWTLNAQKNVKKMGIVSYLSNSCDIIVSKVKIEKGLIATPYSPYGMGSVEIKISNNDNTQSQTAIMPTQAEMLENDYFDYDNEEEVHVWGNVIVNGTETINKNSNSEFFSITKSMSQFDTSVNAIKQSISNYGAGTTLGLGSGNTNNKYSFNASTIYLDCYNSNINTVEKLKAQLAENNMKIYAKLATPQRIAFTDEQKAVAKELNNARTYKNVTNITTDSKAILSLDYAKDLETLLNNTQALAVNNASEGV